MSITLSGPFLLLFAVWVFVFRPSRLSYFIVFFAPFSSTAIVNFTALGYKSGGLGLTPAMLFLMLYFGSKLVRGQAVRGIQVSAGHLIQIGLIGLFVTALLASLMVNGSVRAITPYQRTQTIYVLIGIVATVQLSFEFSRPGGIDHVVRAVRASAIFVAWWGLLQFACFVTHLPYPSFLFNNSLSDAANMFDQDLGGSYMRIASVAVEPSVMAASLLHFVAFGATVLAYDRRFRMRYWMWPVGLSALVLVMSTSTTAYFGLAVLVCLLLIERPRFAISAGLPALGFVGAILVFSPRFRAVVTGLTVDKSSTSSYIERTSGTAEALRLFLEQPFIGWGWGWEQVNWNAITTTLAYTGLIGTLLFWLAGGTTLLNLELTRRGLEAARNPRYAAYAAGARNALIVAFTCGVTSGIKYVFLDDWCFWAIAIAIGSRLTLTSNRSDEFATPSLADVRTELTQLGYQVE